MSRAPHPFTDWHEVARGAVPLALILAVWLGWWIGLPT